VKNFSINFNDKNFQLFVGFSHIGLYSIYYYKNFHFLHLVSVGKKLYMELILLCIDPYSEKKEPHYKRFKNAVTMKIEFLLFAHDSCLSHERLTCHDIVHLCSFTPNSFA